MNKMIVRLLELLSHLLADASYRIDEYLFNKKHPDFMPDSAKRDAFLRRWDD